MQVTFSKYQGTGNDFILFDNRSGIISRENRTWFAQICDRRFGIGADGVMLLENKEGYDFEMVYFNADGGESTMCGNGGRCMVNFAKASGIEKPSYHFLAVDGPHEASLNNGIIKLKMGDVSGIMEEGDHYILNTGSPHYVRFEKDIHSIDIRKEGAAIRNSPAFKAEGINVNFLEEAGGNLLIRTYERGVEDETLSCGTGVTASALVYAMAKNLPPGKHILTLETMGGSLQVEFIKTEENAFNNIYLIGPGQFVFSGSIEYPGA